MSVYQVNQDKVVFKNAPASLVSPHTFVGLTSGNQVITRTPDQVREDIGASTGHPVNILVPIGTDEDIIIEWQTDPIPGSSTVTFVTRFGNNTPAFSDLYESISGRWDPGASSLQPYFLYSGSSISQMIIPFTYNNSVNRKLALS